MFFPNLTSLEIPLRQLQLESIGFSEQEAEAIAHDITLRPIPVTEIKKANEISFQERNKTEVYERIVPAVFAGLILLSIVITGMMIFQSASQEKKEKVVAIVLSSITSSDLMQGKVIAYFLLGIFQVVVWLIVAIPIVQWRWDIPILEYVFVPFGALELVAKIFLFTTILVKRNRQHLSVLFCLAKLY